MKKLKAKVRKGHSILSLPERGYIIDFIMLINFCNKYTYIKFWQKRNHLYIKTTEGLVDIVFTSETPQLEFSHFEKDQLVLNNISKLC